MEFFNTKVIEKMHFIKIPVVLAGKVEQVRRDQRRGLSEATGMRNRSEAQAGHY